jgi:hypothetical protein
VEIDECFRMKRKNKEGRLKEQDWIIGGIERPYLYHLIKKSESSESIFSSAYALDPESKFTPKCFMARVANRKEEELVKIITEKIDPGTIIVSDCWKSYEIGFIHYSVNHSKNFINKTNGACTNRIEGTWHQLRSSFPSRGIKPHMVHLYLAEFMYRLVVNNDI